LTCSIRPSVILGPGDYQLVPTIQRCIAKGETPFIIGEATNLYDFTYVSNVADAHVLAVENLLTSKTAAGEAFFISNGQPVPFRDFCLAIWADFGHVPKYQVRIPTAVASVVGLIAEWVTWFTGTEATVCRGSVKDYTQTAYANLSKAREILGYEAKVSLPEGIRLSCEVSLAPNDPLCFH
jgi:sterol-4alpha-carboxylate 3-dehydrogenase (decarboxylating)